MAPALTVDDGFTIDRPTTELDPSIVLSSRRTNLNSLVLGEITDALEADPEASILSVIPASYESRLNQGSSSLTANARLNRSIIDELQSQLNEDPEADLLSSFPGDYRQHFDEGVKDPSYRKYKKKIPPPPVVHDTLRHLLRERTATVVFPLSGAVKQVISLHADNASEPLADPTDLASALSSLFRASEKLYEYDTRGAVYRCSDEIVAKVIKGFNDSTEYTSMQFLERYAPDIPAPRPHGLVHIGSFWVIFMTYIPSITLEEAWPSLSSQQKASVQDQLDTLLTRLRDLERPDGQPLGGISGEGVKDPYDETYRSKEPIESAAGFRDFKFTHSTRASESYVRFLKNLLPSDSTATRIVFTHGDIRPANIMVEYEQDSCKVTGIIDWEFSGFYPDYHEATKSTRKLSTRESTDWYEYLPPCMAPEKYPQWWLVNRIWENSVCIASW